MSFARQAGAQAISELLDIWVPGEFWVYLFAVLCVLIISPYLLGLAIAALGRRCRAQMPAALSPHLPGKKRERQVHRSALLSLSDDLRAVVDAEHRHGPVFGRTYRIYRWWLPGLLLALLGLFMGWVWLWPLVTGAWQLLREAWAGRVVNIDVGAVSGWMWVSVTIVCVSLFLIPFGSGLYLLWRSRLRQWLHLGDRPYLQFDARGVTHEGYFHPWSAVSNVTRRYERGRQGKESRGVILRLQESGRVPYERRIGVVFLDNIPWTAKDEATSSEAFDWQWLHAMLAYHRSYYRLLSQQTASGAPADNALPHS